MFRQLYSSKYAILFCWLPVYKMHWVKYYLTNLAYFKKRKNIIYTTCKLFLFQYFCVALWRRQKWLTWLHSWNTLYIVNKRPSSAPIFRCGGPQYQVGWLPTCHLNFSGTFFEWVWSSLYKLWCKNHQRHCEICYLV